MYKKRIIKGFVFSVMLLMIFSTASFANAAEETGIEAEVTVIFDETYIFIVDQYGTILSVDQEGAEPIIQTVITFDEDGNVYVEEIEFDEYADLVGLSVVDGINSFVDSESEAPEYEVQVATNPESEEINAFLMTLITGEEQVKEIDEHPNALRFAMADELGITNGKMRLLEKLSVISDDEEFDYDYWSEKSVKEIMAKTKENQKKTGVIESDEDEYKDEIKSFDEDVTENQVEPEDQEKFEVKVDSKSSKMEEKNDKTVKNEKLSTFKKGNGKEK